MNLYSACPVCGYGADQKSPSNEVRACKAQGREVPLRCPHAANPEEHRAWSGELYHHEGRLYVPVVRREPHPDPQHALRGRTHQVVDVEGTLAGKPVEPPKTIPHVHRTCLRCKHEWVERTEGD